MNLHVVEGIQGRIEATEENPIQILRSRKYVNKDMLDASVRKNDPRGLYQFSQIITINATHSSYEEKYGVCVKDGKDPVFNGFMFVYQMHIYGDATPKIPIDGDEMESVVFRLAEKEGEPVLFSDKTPYLVGEKVYNLSDPTFIFKQGEVKVVSAASFGVKAS